MTMTEIIGVDIWSLLRLHLQVGGGVGVSLGWDPMILQIESEYGAQHHHNSFNCQPNNGSGSKDLTLHALNCSLLRSIRDISSINNSLGLYYTRN